MVHKMSKKPPIKETIATLADVAVEARCHACGHQLPGSSEAELFETRASRWIVAKCPLCSLYTPIRLEGIA